MNFEQLEPSIRIIKVKIEFIYIIQYLFNNPEELKMFVDKYKISNKNANFIFKALDTLNYHDCICCREFDKTKIKLSPIQKEFEDLIDIALTNAKSKLY